MVAQQGNNDGYSDYDVHSLYGWSQTQPTLEKPVWKYPLGFQVEKARTSVAYYACIPSGFLLIYSTSGILFLVTDQRNSRRIPRRNI